MKTVFLTGADGFLGSTVAELFAEAGYCVRALVCYNSFGSIGWLDALPSSLKADLDIRLGDIRDSSFIRGCVKGADAVVHLSSLISIPHSYNSYRSYVDTNVGGMVNVLEACREFTIPLISTSTSEVYGSAQYWPIDERHPTVPQSPYAASKLAADHLCEAFSKSYELPITVIRPFNTFGPRQSMRAIIPSVMNQITAGADCIKVGSLFPRRDFTFVRDTAQAFLLALNAELPDSYVLLNLGIGRDISIGELIEKIQLIAGSTLEVQCEERRTRPPLSEVNKLLADNQRARDLLGWSPKYSLVEGLSLSFEFFANRSKSGIRSSIDLQL